MGLKNHMTVKVGPRHRSRRQRRKQQTAIRQLRGIDHEDQACAALKGKFKTKPHWYCGWRKANGFEDHNHGTDIFVHTYLCDVRVDVKSSIEFAVKTEQRVSRIGMTDTIIIVVKNHMTPNDIRYYLFDKIERHLAFRFGRALQTLKAAHR